MRWIAGRFLLGVVGACCIPVEAALCQRPALTVPAGTSFSLRSWNTSTGLAQNSITSVLQARNGVIWAATFGGLCRFDGVEWINYDSASSSGFPDNRILCLHEDADGALWFGSELGVLTRFADGVFEGVARASVGAIRSVMRLADGRLLCAVRSNLLVLGADRQLRPLSDTPSRDCWEVVQSPDGDVWTVGHEGVHWLGSSAAQVSNAGESAAVAPDGTVYFATNRGLFRTRDRHLERVRGWPGGLDDHGRVLEVHVTASGEVWFSTPSHVCRLAGEATNEVAFPVSSTAKTITSDSSGGIWIGFLGGGLSRLRASEVSISSPFSGPCRSTLTSVMGDGAGSWLVGTQSGLFRLQNGNWERVPQLGDRSVHALFRDVDGALWLGLKSGVARLQAGSLTTIAAPNGEEIGWVRAIARDHRGRLLAGCDTGCFVVGEHLLPAAETAVLAGESVNLITKTSDGDLWIGGRRGLLRIPKEDEKTTYWQIGHDLPQMEVRWVSVDERRRIWLGTYGMGFVAIDGDRIRVIGPADGLGDAFLCHVTPVADRWLVGCNRGVFLVDPSQLNDIVDGRSTMLTARPLIAPDEMPLEASGGVEPSSWVQDGKVAMCTIGGLQLVDLHGLLPPGPLLNCEVEPAISGDQRLVRDNAGSLLTACVDRSFVVRCSAPAFDFPQLTQFRWRLPQLDENWSAPTRRRNLSFSVPTAGDFDLEVQALTIDNRPNPASTRLRLRIQPLFWERASWIWLALAAGVAAVVLAAFRFGRRLSARRAQHLQQLVDEQTAELRSAREHLEHRVVERTAELQCALATIETDHQARQELEREVHELQRMESLGQLAGGIAHDFNNLLTVVLGSACLIEIEAAGQSDLVRLAASIREAGERGRSMTQHLLAVASRQAIKPAPLDLSRHVQLQRGVLQNLLGPLVRLDLSTPEASLFINAAPAQIDQILVNLCVNARDAMPDGGVATVALHGDGDRARLRVADTGCGMTEAVKKRMFEPFFTTKAQGAGTGLGLATVYGITKQLAGDVVVETAVGEGTTFVFSFPLTGAPTEVTVPLPLPERPRATIPILLIDDDPSVRAALRRLLQSAGCHIVREAENGADAVDKLAQCDERIEVAVSDVCMPGLQGAQLVDALRVLRPGLPFVFLSGYASPGRSVEELQARGIELLNKPPDLGELMAAIDRARAGVERRGS